MDTSFVLVTGITIVFLLAAGIASLSQLYKMKARSRSQIAKNDPLAAKYLNKSKKLVLLAGVVGSVVFLSVVIWIICLQMGR